MSRYTRQLDLIDPLMSQCPVTIIGAGGIGSFTTLALAKMGFSKIEVYDFDKVEDHNVASQFFKESQLGMLKVDALYDNVKEQTGIEISKSPIKIEQVELLDKGIIIIAVDSMEVRAYLSETYKHFTNTCIIDGRMGGLQGEIYVMNPASYPQTIVNSEQVSHEPCTARAIAFNCMVLGGFIASQVRLTLKTNVTNYGLIYLFNTNTLLKKTYL